MSFISNFDAVLFLSRSEKLKPFWLSVSDPLPTLDHLSSVLLAGDYPSPEYRKALERALDIPQCKLIPFFGGFLRELRAVLQGMPSLVVLPAPGAQKLEVTILNFSS